MITDAERKNATGVLEDCYRNHGIPNVVKRHTWVDLVGYAAHLESYFAGKPIRQEYLVVDKGKLAGVGAHSYTAGDATKGSEEAAKFNK